MSLHYRRTELGKGPKDTSKEAQVALQGCCHNPSAELGSPIHHCGMGKSTGMNESPSSYRQKGLGNIGCLYI